MYEHRAADAFAPSLYVPAPITTLWGRQVQAPGHAPTRQLLQIVLPDPHLVHVEIVRVARRVERAGSLACAVLLHPLHVPLWHGGQHQAAL